MQGLMMDYPLTLTQFFERSRRLFAQKTLTTRVPGRPLFRSTYADFAERVARLAGGLAALGVRPGDRVGTFAWNTHHHLEAYWAVPLMSAVLHTVNFKSRKNKSVPFYQTQLMASSIQFWSCCAGSRSRKSSVFLVTRMWCPAITCAAIRTSA